jgi:uncharacterized protein (TIGR02996 family)
MSDQAALYAAILANPDEDTPRLLYADWLEENGQPKAAKYIRAACELSRLDEDDPSLAAFPTETPSFWQDVEPEVAKYRALAAVALPRDHAKAELARLPKRKGFAVGGYGAPGDPFRRGFVERACFKTAADFVRQADAVFRAAPIRELVINNSMAGDLDQVAASRWFPQIRSLTLGGRDISQLWAMRLREFCDSGNVGTLRSLTLGNAEPGCLSVLANDKAWGGLRQLSVARRELDDDAPDANEQLTELCNAKHLRMLKAVELDRVQISSEDAITTAHWPDLRVLVYRNEGGGLGTALSQAKHLRKLRALSVLNSYLEGPEIAQVVSSPNLPNLAVLDVTRNWIEGFGKNDFKKAKGQSLRRLAVSTHHDRVTPKWEPLFKWVAGSGLVSFALGNDSVLNETPAKGAMQALMKCGDFPNLRRIEMRKKMITATLRKHFGARLREWAVVY